jgi:hypothetical protein
MKTSIIAGSLLTALTLTVPLQAQQVAADVVLRSGPVAGHVVIGNGYSTYRRPVVYRAPARVIVVERLGHRNRGFARSWRQQGYRQVVVYYRDGRYYDRYVRGWPEMREVVVYERNGRLYREWEDDRDRHRDHDHHDDRHWSD